MQVSVATTNQWADHSDRVLLQTRRLVATLNRVQNLGHRAKSWRRALRDVPAEAATLVRLVADNPKQESSAKAISTLALRAIALQRLPSQEIGSRSVRAVPATPAERRHAIARVFAQLEPFSDEEDRLSQVRNDLQSSTWFRNDAVMVATAIVVGLIITVSNLRFSRQIVMRLALLVENANRLSLGHEMPKLIEGNDEIVELDRSLHVMARILQEGDDISRRYSLLANATTEIFLLIRRSDGRVIEANNAASVAYQYAREELLQLHVADVRAADTLGDVDARLAEIDRGAAVYQTRHRRRDGTAFPVEVASTIAHLHGEKIIVSVVRDVTERRQAEAAMLRAEVSEAGRAALEREIAERKQAERRLAFAAFHDELTGLLNRALFMDRLRETIAGQARHAGESAALLFVDLDRFKVINDSLGHSAGDELLVELARRLKAHLRRGETLARFGGDEFTYLLGRVDNESAATALAERVLSVFDAPFHIAGRDVFASASIGIAMGRAGSSTPEELLRNADIAMYDAKERGKRRYAVFTPALLARAVVLQELETDLQRALERAEFRLYYQPILRLEDGSLKGFEALIRWQHPQRGLLGPDAFIDVAEATGAIVPVGAWVLHEACGQMQAWREAHPGAQDLSMSVNVAAKQLALPTFARTVAHACERSGLPADRLNVEITESALMENDDAVRVNLKALRSSGVRVHLDDFGTGYSSLSYLRKFEIDVLKIDRSFVSSAGDGIASPELVRTILALAQDLGIDVTAEGIETAEQRRQLAELNCSYGQGYYFARPLDATSAGRFIVAFCCRHSDRLSCDCARKTARDGQILHRL
jgi:diguanylate cyclase (GGDEF)-like protein/PAS domain S-box-containing protein